MLVLTRRVGDGDSIVIGDPSSEGEAITVQLLEVRGGEVRIGIHAPKSVQVHRAEIWALKQQEQQQA